MTENKLTIDGYVCPICATQFLLKECDGDGVLPAHRAQMLKSGAIVNCGESGLKGLPLVRAIDSQTETQGKN
jgi:hypothetical protein